MWLQNGSDMNVHEMYCEILTHSFVPAFSGTQFIDRLGSKPQNIGLCGTILNTIPCWPIIYCSVIFKNDQFRFVGLYVEEYILYMTNDFD